MRITEKEQMTKPGWWNSDEICMTSKYSGTSCVILWSFVFFCFQSWQCYLNSFQWFVCYQSVDAGLVRTPVRGQRLCAYHSWQYRHTWTPWPTKRHAHMMTLNTGLWRLSFRVKLNTTEEECTTSNHFFKHLFQKTKSLQQHQFCLLQKSNLDFSLKC